MGRPREFDTNEALVQAVHVFWERGYTEASIQDLCSAMNINSGSLYSAFGAKQDIFRSAIKHYIAMVSHEGIGRVEAAETGIAGVRAYFDYVVEGILTGMRCNGCLGTNSFMEVSETDPEIKALMMKHFQVLEAAFNRALSRDGSGEPQSQAKFLVCVAQGLNVLARTNPDRDTLEQIVSTATKNLN